LFHQTVFEGKSSGEGKRAILLLNMSPSSESEWVGGSAVLGRVHGQGNKEIGVIEGVNSPNRESTFSRREEERRPFFGETFREKSQSIENTKGELGHPPEQGKNVAGGD